MAVQNKVKSGAGPVVAPPVRLVVLLAVVLVKEAEVGVTARGEGGVTLGGVLAGLLARLLGVRAAPLAGVGVVVDVPSALVVVEDAIKMVVAELLSLTTCLVVVAHQIVRSFAGQTFEPRKLGACIASICYRLGNEE